MTSSNSWLDHLGLFLLGKDAMLSCIWVGQGGYLKMGLESWKPRRGPLSSVGAGRRDAKSLASGEMLSCGIISARWCWVLCSVMHLELIWEPSQLILGGKMPTQTCQGLVFSTVFSNTFQGYCARRSRKFKREPGKGQWLALTAKLLPKESCWGNAVWINKGRRECW